MISQVSTTLQELVTGHSELYLDQFTGEIEGIQDVVEMLYGGEVELSEQNYRTILKFSVVYKVEDMYELCLKWIKENVSGLDLFGLIKFGLLIERIDDDNNAVLELCVTAIKKDGFSKKSKEVMAGQVMDNAFIKFFIQVNYIL